MAQPFRRNQREKITLILRKIFSRFQRMPVYGMHLQSGIMTGGNRVRAASAHADRAQRGVQQGPEFHGAVTQGAGIGRARPDVSTDKGGYHLAPKRRAQILHLERDPQLRAQRAQTWNSSAFPGRIDKQGMQGHDLMPGFTQGQQGAEAVHAPTYGNGDFHTARMPCFLRRHKRLFFAVLCSIALKITLTAGGTPR